MFFLIGVTGCAETVYLNSDKGTESIKVISDFWYYIWLSLCVTWAVLGIVGYFVAKCSPEFESSLWLFWLIMFLLISFLFSLPIIGTTTRSEFTTNTKLIAASQKYNVMSRTGLNNQEYELKTQIYKVKENIVSLKKERDQKILPLKQNYSQMYNQYYPQLTQQLPETDLQSHQDLLKNCEQYLELCSSINRVAKLQYYISKLDDKIKQIGANIIKLDDNVWNMERNFELSQIFSNEELENVEQLIEETKGKIDSQVPPPERQDIAGLEEKIFNDILRS